MKRIGLLILCIVSIFSFAQISNNSDKKDVKKNISKKERLPSNTQVWVIDAELTKCEGATAMQCLLVKKQGQKSFELFYDNITGFDYQEGFVYTIWVKEETKIPPIAAYESIYNYVLVKIISKNPIARHSNNTINNKKPLGSINTSTTKTLIINEEKTACEGNSDAKCLLIKQPDSKTFEIFYQGIEGFTFEEGYRQTILVNERYIANPMIKQTEPIYTLIKVIKKELINAVKKDEVIVSNQPKTPLDKKWILRKMKDSDTTSFEIDDDAVFIEFRSAENKINGKAPCNTYFGGFKSDFISSFQAISFSTRMYCENMKFEDIYLALLQKADKFEIREGKLNLYKGEKLLLIFE